MKRDFTCLVFVLALGCASSSSGNDPSGIDAAGEEIAGFEPDAIEDIEAGDETIEAAPEVEPFLEPKARVLFDLFATPVDSPFPYDYYRDATSGRLRLDSAAFSNSLLPMLDTFEGFVEAFNEADGFATYGPLVFLTSVPLDESSLPKDEAATLDPGSSVRLVLLEGTQPSRQVPLRVEYREMESQEGPKYLVTALPFEPLEEGCRYLFVVTDRVKAADGKALGASMGFAEVAGRIPIRSEGDPVRRAIVEEERARLAPLIASLPDEAHVVAAVDFTVGHAIEETVRMMKGFWKGGDWSKVGYTLDGDGDGADDVFFGEDYKECPMKDGELAYGVVGAFEPVNFTGPQGVFVKQKDGSFEQFPPERVHFWLMVPAREGPAPVVILVHGIDADHSQLCDVARDLVRVGLATLRFDLPRHGERGGGAMDFLDLTRPAKIRDNMRQAAADLASATLLIEALSGHLDFSGGPGGDLDGGRIGFLGHSLGGIVGALFLPLSDRVGPAVINVGGVGLFHIVESYILSMGSGGMYEVMGIVHSAPHLLWPADGVSVARRILLQPIDEALPRHQVLLHEHIGDNTVPNVTTELLARFAGIPLLKPFVKPVPGLEVADPAETTSGLWQVDGVTHWAFITSPDDPHIKVSRRQAAHFLKTALESGKAEILVQ